MLDPLYRVVDSRGQTIDFLLSVRRDIAAAERLFRKALGRCTRRARVPSRWANTRPTRARRRR
ncbi:MAG: DDE domain-containing protein [Alphaproteobacteria bacterium]|nr:MAG: DDE domain-containing protein [Alphaproteobacteria bacterium]